MFNNSLQGDRMEHRLQVTLTGLLVASLLVVSGCSQQAPAPQQGGIQSLPFSVVATGDSAADIRDATTFAWARDLQKTSPDQNAENVPVDALLQAAIIDTLQGKGYRYSAVPGEGDLIIDYRVALDDSRTDREAGGTTDAGLQPSLTMASPDPARYEKGTLEIEVTDRATGLVAWRSALQGFANHDLDEAERRQRLGLMVDRMLAGVPAK